jgi:hypothetical protein
MLFLFRGDTWFGSGVSGACGVLALVACSSTQAETGFDASTGPTVGVLDGSVDVTTPPSADSGEPPSLTGDANVAPATDSGPASLSTDAAYSFDGFAHPDGYSEASYCTDDDGDGFTTCDGDCDDHDSLVNPCAFDTDLASGDPVGKDGIDNDCDGKIDNRVLCDSALATAGHDTVAADYASAIDLCNNQRCSTVVSATFNTLSDNTARRITAHMGNNALFHPHAGAAMAFLSSGIADDDIDTPAYRTGDGHDFQKTGTNPDPLPAAKNPNACGTGADEGTVSANDIVELDLTLKAPVNAGSFTFDFNFFSEEYPSFVCAGFNDTFLAELTSIQYPLTTYPHGFQIAFDALGHRVNVNNGFFSDCASVAPPSEAFTHTCTGALTLLKGTGYEIPYSGNDELGSGATDWLKTTAPIQPGETFTLRFYIFDEQDGILDSAINLDNFRWGSTTVPNPVTAR